MNLTAATLTWLLAAAPPAAEAAASPDVPAGPFAQNVTMVLEYIIMVGLVTLVLGIVLCLWRILRGPHLADRVLGADALSLHVAGLVIVLAVQLRTTAFFDVVLVVAILGFVSTLAFAQFIGARRRV